MKGKDIANNLRGSKLPWGKGKLCQIIKGKRHYCVLGIKAREAGVSATFLNYVDGYFSGVYRSTENGLTPNEMSKLVDVYSANDGSYEKVEVIKMFDDFRRAETEYPIEKFVRYLKRIERAWKAEQKVKRALLQNLSPDSQQ